MDLIQINLTYGHLITRIFKVVFEQVKIAFVDFVDQMHREVVKVVFNRMRALGAVPFAFVKPGDFFEVDRVRGLDRVQHVAHAVVERLRPDDFIVFAAIHNEGADVAGLAGPVDVRVHWAAPTDGVTGEQQEATETRNLIEFLLSIVSTNLDPVFLDQKWDQIATVAFAVTLNSADLVKERTEDSGVRITDACEGE
mgnify:CR=1 FL=1